MSAIQQKVVAISPPNTGFQFTAPKASCVLVNKTWVKTCTL